MDTATIEEKFHHAVQLIRNLPKSGSYQPSNELKLKFYSYFKQATEGPCDAPKPGFWDVVSRAKWEAWNHLGEMSKEEAMERYVDEFVKIIKNAPFDERANDYVHLMGPFIYLAPKEFRDKHVKVNGDVKSNLEDDSHKPEEIIENNYNAMKTLKGRNPDLSADSSEDSCQHNGHNVNGATESDSDEFSDTFDQVNGGESDVETGASATVGQENNANSDGRFSPILHSSKGSNITEARGGGDQRVVTSDPNSPLPGGSENRGSRGRHRSRGYDFLSHHYHNNSASGGSGGGRRNNDDPPAEPASDVSEQLAFAVIRLQHTMEQVVSRLDSLEALLQERKSDSCLNVSTVKNSFWSVFGIPARAALLIIAWPFIAQWLMLIIQKRRRRRL